MKPFKLNATSARIVDFIRSRPGQTKRDIATGLGLAASTVDSYIGPLKAGGYIEADHNIPARYRPSSGTGLGDPTPCVVAAMHAMISAGLEAA